MGLKTLDEIAIACGTDKATVFTRTQAKPKGYTIHLDALFTPFRDQPIKLLEIGVGGGESIRTWLEYFTQAWIYGIDIVQNTNEWNSPENHSNKRYQFSQGNQCDVTMWACALANWSGYFDIVIDDGSHMADGVITAFECLWPHTRVLYCIEDLGVATSPGTVFVPSGWPNHLDWIRDKMKEMNNGSDIESLTFYPELCVFRKRV